MTKPRGNVQFQHRRSGSTGSRQRRMSGSTHDGEEYTEKNGNGDTPQPQPETSDREKKKQTIVTRTIWSLVMIGGFFACLFAGHIYIIMLLTAIQIVSFKEVINIINVPAKSRDRSLRFTKTLSWYFLGTAIYFLYGESMIYYFKHIILVDRVLLPFATHHRFISFMLYIFGFVFFVGSLRKGHYRFQFTQFAWTHLALFLIVVQAHFVVNNVFEGMIWFFLPAALVITNDVFAYICGMTFGRTQLIKLSPKKTVEGFVGAWVFTILFGYLLTNLLMDYKYWICPVDDLGASAFSGLDCTPNPVFTPRKFDLLGTTITTEPIQFHVFVFSTFASLIAPFGGFFASGVKRTFKIKDFGDSIPGHGGITDRMDCQFIMGTLTFMYYQGFIAQHKANVGTVIEMAIHLTPDEQMEVVKGLTKHLVNQGVIPASVMEYLGGHLAIRR